MVIRRAEEADSADVLKWRNHPEVRAVSLTQHQITEAEHDAWWARTMNDPTRLVCVYEFHGQPAGVVSFFDIDRESRRAWWGYYLDNAGLNERGELLPAWMQIQREAKKYAFDELDLDELLGEVMEANEAVRRMNRMNRFEEVGSYQREIDGKPATVLRIRAVSPRLKEKEKQ